MRGRRALVVGAVAGVVLAAWGIVAPGGRHAVPPDAVAIVNGVPIRAAQYRRALAGVASDRRDGTVDDGLRRHVLDRLIEEELLVQRGLALGLARTDRRVRGELTAAVIAAVLADVDETPSDAEVDAFYAEHPDVFRAPGRVQVEQIFFDERREADARAARRQLDDGAGFDRVRSGGDPEPVPVPAAPLPPERLVDYLGPTVARAALGLPEGGVAGPLRSGWGYHVVRVAGREDASLPPLDDVRAEVRGELVRRAGDRRLRDYLDRLRAGGEVVVAETPP
jgi:parvulin-like peptidyl-prolyl isomerase